MLLPAAILIFLTFYAGLVWTVYVSFTRSGIVPNYTWSGLVQYQRLFADERWMTAYPNMFVFGAVLIGGALVFGTVLAIVIDQNVKAEGLFRAVFLYPLSVSFIVSGLAWQWLLNPTLGLQASVQALGYPEFTFDWIARADRSIYTVAIGAIWHSSGLVMAIMLAGMRNIDAEIWRATRVDGIPRYRVYLSIIIPMLRPMVLTCVILLVGSVIRAYDLVVAMTQGGPGFASDLPAKFVVDSIFERGNLGLGSAGAVIMLVSMTIAVAPYFYIEMRRRA
ncbi:MAG: carbohydrate ABC transporter permease [Luteimonas sp.]